MLDLGANINLMPHSVFLWLGLWDFKLTNVTLQRVDRTIKYLKGIVDDLLVQVEKLIVHVDFVILDIEEHSTRELDQTILLGILFMATIHTIIDVHNGKLSMMVLG